MADEQPWAPWLSGPWLAPWLGWRSSAGPAARPAGRSGWSAARIAGFAARGPALTLSRPAGGDARSAGRRPVLREVLLCPRRRSPPRGGGVSRLAFISLPSSLSHARVACVAQHAVAPRHSAGSAGPRRRRRVRRRASTR